MMKVQRVSEIIFCYLIPLVFLGAFLHSSVTEIQYGLHRDYAEGTTLAYIEHWRTHASEPRSIYSPEAMMPGQVMGYPFLHLGLVSLFSQDASQALMIGRSLSVICALLVSIVAWLILRRTLYLSLKYLPLLTTLIIYQSAVFDWSLLARSDLLAYLFEILGLYFYLSEWDQKDKTHWKTLFLFAASFCCKQNYILGPLVVIALECIYNKKKFFRKAPLYIGATLGLGLLVTAVFGLSYWDQTLIQLQQPQYGSRLVQLLSSYAIANALLVILSFAFIVTNTSLGTFKTFLLIYLSFGILLALIGLGRSGSNFNYFIPVAVPLAMMSLLTLKELLQQFRFCNVVIMCALFILFAQSYLEVNSTVAYSYRFLNHRIWPPTHSDAQASLHQTRVQLKALKTKSVFCDEPGTCTLLGFKPTYFYFEQNSQDVAKARLEDYDTYLLSDIPSRDLTWTKVKLPSSLVQILEEQYQLTALTPLGVVYTKKPAQ